MIDAPKAAPYRSRVVLDIARPPGASGLRATSLECGPLSGATPTSSGIAPLLGDFDTMLGALDYAAQGQTGLNFFSVKGELTCALSYRALALASRALAAKLPGAGLLPGERVAIVAETRPDFVIAFFACQYAGLVPVPLPLPAAFGGRDAYLAHVGRLVAESRAAALFAPETLVDWLAPLVGDEGLRLCCTVAELSQAGYPDAALPPADPAGIAYLQFSSGSTRFPLGVVVHHAALRRMSRPCSGTDCRCATATGRSPGCRSTTTWGWWASCSARWPARCRSICWRPAISHGAPCSGCR